MHSFIFINQLSYIISFREKEHSRILDARESVLQNNNYCLSLKYEPLYLHIKVYFYSLIYILKSEATAQDDSGKEAMKNDYSV